MSHQILSEMQRSREEGYVGGVGMCAQHASIRFR